MKVHTENKEEKKANPFLEKKIQKASASAFIVIWKVTMDQCVTGFKDKNREIYIVF